MSLITLCGKALLLTASMLLTCLAVSCVWTVRPPQMHVPFRLENGMEFVSVGDGMPLFCTTEVSNSQFREFRAGHSSGTWREHDLSLAALPVVSVDWNDAAAFCRWLNQKFAHTLPDGYEFRLPTEAEWMVAAREDVPNRRFPWGDSFPIRYGNYADQAFRNRFPDVEESQVYLPTSSRVEQYNDGHPVACDVAQAGVNQLGVHGLSGNVSEWCRDTGGPSGEGLKERIAKSATWANGGYSDLYEVYGNWVFPVDFKAYDLGFRVVFAEAARPPAAE